MQKLLETIDKVILNILSVFIAGAGLFAVLTKYKVPEINYSFWDSNPFAIKRDIIDGELTWYFLTFALLGLVFRLVALVYENKVICERKYSNRFYMGFSFVMLFLMFICISIIGNIGRYTSKMKWFPKAIQNQKESFLQSKYIIEHDGLREDQVRQKNSISDIDKYRRINYESAEKAINQIEKLLEIKKSSTQLQDRIEYLERAIFNEKWLKTTSGT